MNKIKKSRKQTMKKEIYFNEINLLMGSGGIVYLPFVSGILSSYIKTSQFLKNKIKVMPYIFIPDTVDNLIQKYNNPSVSSDFFGEPPIILHLINSLNTLNGCGG